MSTTKRQDWLLSHSRQSNTIVNHNYKLSNDRKAVTVSVTSGKGGVGKTSVAIKMAKLLAKQGSKTLLIDCDYNLSNTQLKLNLPIKNDFYSLISSKKPFDECLHKDGNFHLLSGCNGDLELFDASIDLDRFIVDIIATHESEYDYIILDCAAGLEKVTLNLNAYTDYRFFVVTPDKSSITDSYSLIKILAKKYAITDNHLIVNKVSGSKQYQKIVKSMTDTVDYYLQGKLKAMGGIQFYDVAVDLFDGILVNDADSKIQRNFLKIIERFVEEHLRSGGMSMHSKTYAETCKSEQEVQSPI
jgi:flagellar biosynthesis protein FlhG